nr:NAD(P)-dependent oxidoreductase [Eubacterium ramulus]
MNVLLIGGSGSLINSLIVKFKKEGHRIFLLTGDRYKKQKYEPVFERYNFAYSSENLQEIMESVRPDITIYTGAFDPNYRWMSEERETVRFTSDLMNVLVAYSTIRMGKFIFLSSHEVYEGYHENALTEDIPPETTGYRGTTLIQAEEICNNYRKNWKLDLLILRLDHLFCIPESAPEIHSVCARMCLESMRDGCISADSNHEFAMLYEQDAVEFIFQIVKSREHKFYLYHLSSDCVISEVELAGRIQKCLNNGSSIVTVSKYDKRCILSGKRFQEEFGMHTIFELDEIIGQTIDYMRKHEERFDKYQESRDSWWKILWKKWKWVFQVIVPFVENLLCFIPFFMLNNRMTDSAYFTNLDPYLLYVLVFAIIYGQQQATFSAVCAVAGYLFRQMYQRTGFEVVLDYNTYVWIAQLFILGLIVGYMRDQIRMIRRESLEMEEHLTGQIADLQEINATNVRIKAAMEQQLIGHQDSIGKIYQITSRLEQQMPDIYQELAERRVYINKAMAEEYPLMATAIYEEEEIRLIIMVWGLSWEHMTLGEANFLTVVSYLIQNAVLRAQRYIKALEEARYREGSEILEPEAFESLVRAYEHAQGRNLTQYTLLCVSEQPERYEKICSDMRGLLRSTDYMGMRADGKLYVLLTNTGRTDAVFVEQRFEKKGYPVVAVEIE